MKKFIYCLFAFLICVAPLNVKADEKSFSIENLNIHCDIENNGDLSITEELLYDFKGSFNGVYVNLTDSTSHKYEIYDVATKNGDSYSSLSKSTDSGNNSYQLTTSDNKTQVKIFSKSSNEKKSFLIKYKVKGACIKYSDYSELNWNFFNVTDNKPINDTTLTISLKDSKFDTNKLKYFVSVDGDFATENNDTIIKLCGKNLSEKLGVKVQFQKEFLNIPISNSTQNSKDKTTSLFGVLAIASTLLIICGVSVYSTKKRKRLFNEELNKYRKDFSFFSEDILPLPPSDLDPALVALLYDETLNNTAIIPATLFYLAKKGYYSLEQSKSNDMIKTSFIRNQSKIKPSSVHLQNIIEWFSIYEVDGHFDLNDIKNIISDKKVASTFRSKYLCFLSNIKLAAIKLNFYTKIREKDILSNEAYNEKLKWLAYRNYLLSEENLSYIDKNELSYELIYKTVLDNENIITDLKDYYDTNSQCYDDLYIQSYIMNVTLFDDIHSQSNTNTTSNDSQFIGGDDNNFGGFSDSSSFSGGGGSDSGAF